GTYLELLPDRTRALGPDHPHTLNTRYQIAWWTYQSGNTTKAIELLTALLHDRTRVLGPNHSSTQLSKKVLQRWKNKLSGQ
ncbi:tetratricopeptide repeat protein, partial [Nocardiopsis alborubida]